ncbi:MAG: hypothetical protein WAQ08_18765 [Aquabacterium sp.]|jgi:hypothetical protein|uniref:hypothetical protein n=1 Tax=Aquabacterium sp. TaxID=1872578 RepID=UPI003BAFD11A
MIGKQPVNFLAMGAGWGVSRENTEVAIHGVASHSDSGAGFVLKSRPFHTLLTA